MRPKRRSRASAHVVHGGEQGIDRIGIEVHNCQLWPFRSGSLGLTVRSGADHSDWTFVCDDLIPNHAWNHVNVIPIFETLYETRSVCMEHATKAEEEV